MARLQILELPEGSGDDRPPFVLVVDEYVARRYITGLDQPESVGEFDGIAQQIGARAVLVFEDTIDIPANDTTAYLRDSLPPDAHYETFVGGRPIEWTHASDGQRLADERTDIARDMDRLAHRREQLADALGIGQGCSWDDIRNAAAELRKQRDTQSEANERVRQLHKPVVHRNEEICWACSAYDFVGQTTDNSPVAYDQCGTLRALNGQQEPA